MSLALVIANIERAGDHAAALVVFVLVAAVGGLVYGLIYLVRSRARSGRGPEGARDPEAMPSDRGSERARGRGPAA